MKKLTYFSITLIILALFHLSTGRAFALYPGEEMRTGDGYPALVKFVKGDPKKPLVIFFPGGYHLARIAYGYPGGNEKDFMAYWIHKKGYPFLAISYPLGNPVFSKVYPEFSIRNWGKQGAEIAKQFIAENGLNNHVIFMGWSMGVK